MSQSRAEKVREYLAAHPGSTSPAVAAGTGLTRQYVTHYLSSLYAGKFATRHEAGKSLTGVQIYAYALTDKKPGKTGPKGPRKKKIQQTNVSPPNRVTPNPHQPQSLDSLVESMAAALVAQVVERVRAKLPVALSQVTPALEPQTTATTPDLLPPIALTVDRKVVRKPHVGVVGLLPVQAGEIVKEFGEHLNLVFWNDGEDKSRLRHIATGCEAVFLHTRHSGHHTDQLLKAHGANLRRITGGTSNMKVSIRAYFEEKKNETVRS